MKTYTAKELAEHVNGVVSGNGERTISGVNSLKMAADTDVSFLSTIKYKKQLDESKAGIVLVEEGMKLEPTETRTLIFCENPDKAFTKICNLFAPEPIVYEPRICPGAYIDPTAKVAEGVFIGPNAVIMPYAEIGKGTVIGGGADRDQLAVCHELQGQREALERALAKDTQHPNTINKTYFFIVLKLRFIIQYYFPCLAFNIASFTFSPLKPLSMIFPSLSINTINGIE